MQKLDDFQTENFDLIAGRRAFARSSRPTSPPTPLQGAVTISRLADALRFGTITRAIA
jgi:hypothetical protein